MTRSGLLALLLVALACGAPPAVEPDPLPASFGAIPGDASALDRDIYACGFGAPQPGLPTSEEGLRDAALTDARANLVQRLAALDLGDSTLGDALKAAGRMRRLAALVNQADQLDIRAEGTIRQARVRIGLADVRALLSTPALTLDGLGARTRSSDYAPPGQTVWPWAEAPHEGHGDAFPRSPLSASRAKGLGPRLYLATPWRPRPAGTHLVVAGTLIDSTGVATLRAGRSPDRMVLAGGTSGIVRPFRLVLPLAGAERLHLQAENGAGDDAHWVIELTR